MASRAQSLCNGSRPTGTAPVHTASFSVRRLSLPDDMAKAKPATTAKKKIGRPPVHDRNTVGLAVCERVANGELVKTVCEDLGLTAKTVRQWAAEDATFGALYARAREDQAHSLAEQAIIISDGDDALTLLREEAIEQAAEEMQKKDDKHWAKKVAALYAGVIARDRMRVDTIKWMASKIAPKSYGERMTQELVGRGGGPVEVRVRIAREGRRITAS